MPAASGNSGGLPGGPPATCPARHDDIAYRIFSGSTRFPHGVSSPPRLLDNLRAPRLQVQDTTLHFLLPLFPTWARRLPASPSPTMSVDSQYEDFAGGLLPCSTSLPQPGTTLSYSPTFGYDICARRTSSQTRAEDRFDLSRWRIAGNGADMIRPDVMQAFVDCFAAAGFKASAFCPSYGLAEATLAVSLMPPGEGIPWSCRGIAVGQRRRRERPRRFRPSSIAASR